MSEMTVKRVAQQITAKNGRHDNRIALENIEGHTGRLISTNSEYDGEGISFQKGDVLYGKLRPYLAKVHHASRDGEAIGDFYVVRPDTVDGRYLTYLLLSPDVTEAARNAGYGAKMPRVGWEFVSSIPVPISEKNEQIAIAAFLDHETGKIDELIAEQERLIALLDEKRQAVISHAVTKGLDPDVEIKDSGIEWLGEVPAHWAVGRIKNSVASTKMGIWGSDPTGDNDDISCVRVADYNRRANRVSEEIPTMRSVKDSERNGRILSYGDLLLERSGGGDSQPVGCVVMYQHSYPSVCSNFISRVTLKEDMNSAYWCYFHAAAYNSRLNAKSIKQVTGIQNLDQSAYLNECAPFPPKKEQDEIAKYLDTKTYQFMLLSDEARSGITLLKERRSALISAAVTGKIDVRNHPAAVAALNKNKDN